ncbi:extracellular solute-binding protein [Blautia sp.]|uniref:extracellular solute-binding protein n=1 Tax=Blautia sp. TaxID=1955243 RepID=UPI003AB51A23
MKKWMRTAAYGLLMVMAVGSVGGKAYPVMAQKKEAAAGRYMENEISLPETGCVSVEDICFLEDGTFRAVYRDQDALLKIADSRDKGKTWTDPRDLHTELFPGEKMKEPVSAALCSDGGIFSLWYGEDQKQKEAMAYYLSADGEKREIPLIEYAGNGMEIYDAAFTASGSVILMGKDAIYEISVKDGSLLRTYEKGNTILDFGIVGNRLVVFVNDTIHYYDTETGEPLTDEPVLTEELCLKKDQSETETASSHSVVMTGSDEDGILYVNRGGMYLYYPGGTMVEQLFEGQETSVGLPETGLMDVETDEEGRVYLAASDVSSEKPKGKIYCYQFDGEASVAETELEIYTLLTDPYIEQAAVMFQKEHPEIRIEIQEGMTGKDGVTATDAIKNLNTEIMAGEGPDVMLLDGLLEEDYIEKGMLEDISGIVESAGILENIRDVYTEEDGAVYRMPLRFGIPMIAGKAEDVDMVDDLASLKDMVKKHKADFFPGFFSAYKARVPQILLTSLFEISSPSWMKKDGRVDEEKVREFLELTYEIYHADKEYEGYAEDTSDSEEKETRWYEKNRRQEASPVMDLLLMGAEKQLFSYGYLFSLDHVFLMNTMETENPEFTHRLFNGQEKNCFAPELILGISAAAREKEAAQMFVEFLFSEEQQKNGKEAGFPVRKSVYESDEYWELGREGSFEGASSATYNGEMTELIDVLHSSDSQLKEIRELGKTLTTPVGRNRVLLDAVKKAGVPYLKNETDLDQAVRETISQVNLYLSE